MRAEIQFNWPKGKPLESVAHKCHEAVVEMGDRIWDVKGARRVGKSVYLLEHVCQGRLGKKARSKRALRITGELFDTTPNEDQG